MAFIEFDKPIRKGRFIKRYKRFFADIKMDNGNIITAHCPNTGTMKSCLEENAPAIVWDSKNPKRKLKYSFKAISINGVWIGIDTILPNKLAMLCLQEKEIDQLSSYRTIEREKQMGLNSRVDLLLSDHPDKPGQLCFVEVKNVTLVENKVALFPDAVTTRGQKHLIELMQQIDNGHEAAMLYMIQRKDGKSFEPAKEIDPKYAELLVEAKHHGVMIFAMSCEVCEQGVKTTGLVEINL